MSRIGKQHIALPSGTEVTKQAEHFEVRGPKGVLTVPAFEGISTSIEDGSITLNCEDEEKRNFYGLSRMLLANAVQGVSIGWKRDLELHGVGMRAATEGSNLNLSLGFSHPVIITAPEGITFQVVKNVITVSGIDKQLVGETAAQIRRLRKPEPYKGKGVRYSDEHVRRKAGKTGKAGK